MNGEFYGYSTDIKPMTDNQKGYKFIELDTKNIYIWDGTKWVVW